MDAGRKTGEMLHDQRLFNQNGGAKESLASGYGTEDAHRLYDRLLFTRRSASAEHQRTPPRRNDEGEGGGSLLVESVAVGLQGCGAGGALGSTN